MRWYDCHQPHPQAASFVLVASALIHSSVLSTGPTAALCIFAGVGAHTHVTNPQATLVQLIPLLPISKADKLQRKPQPQRYMHLGCLLGYTLSADLTCTAGAWDGQTCDGMATINPILRPHLLSW